MRKLGYFAAAAIGLAACSDQAPTPVAPVQVSQARQGGSDREVVPGRYIVVFDDAVSDVSARARALVAAHGGSLVFTYTAALKGFAVSGLADAAAAAIGAAPGVRYVEQDQVMRVIAEQTGATWGIDRVDQRNLPLSTTYVYNATGDGVHAYIIDTGIRRTHSEFTGRMGNGRDEVTQGGTAEDCNGHGTHVAGTVGGTTYGVAKSVTLHPVRVLDCAGSGTNSGVIAGVDWVTGQKNANSTLPMTANMSLGGGFSQALNDAVTRSTNAGVVYAVAAGNDYGNACDGSPASTPSAMTIGATDMNDVEAGFSDRGSCLDMWAPGVNITSAWYTGDNATNTISGTSMATPHVVGAIALYLETNKTASPAVVDDELTRNATTGKITWNNPYGAKPAPPPAGQDYLLYTGFINGAPPTPTPAPAAPTALVATPVSASQVNLAWVDNSDNETGFDVERCTGMLCTNFVNITTVGTNVTSYSNTGLAASTAYTYRVRAKNSGGNSGYSNEASATTLAAPPPPPNASPVAKYTWSCSGKAGRVCSFDGTSSTDDKAVTGWTWTFPGGSTASGSTTTRTFASRGTYSVKLTVRDAEGLTGTTTCGVQTGTSGSCAAP